MTIQLTPKDIDHIIELIEQITNALIKSDFLTAQEKNLLDRYRSCKLKIELIAEARQVRGRKELSEDERRAIETEYTYDRDKAKTLKQKLSKVQAEHTQSMLSPLQKKLDLYLTPRWAEILTLCTKRDQLKSKIEWPFLKQTLNSAITAEGLATKKAEVVHELERIRAKLEYNQKKRQELQQPAEPERNRIPAKMKYDVFICHASEDKKDFVKPLADALIKEKMRVWYDEFELTLGDSLREKIDYGLANSEYGVVVLSEAFFRGKWPQNELDGLVARQNSEGKKVILPVWHKVSYDEVKRFSLTLAGKLAAKSEKGIKQVVDDILRVINHSDLQYELLTTNKNTSEKPTEPEENTTPAKGERESWLWRLYERTLKVIVDAVLDRMWLK